MSDDGPVETNVIHCGDCKDVLKRLPDGCVDLIYIDPPFFSQKNYETFWVKDQTTRTAFADSDWEQLRSTVDPQVLAEYEAIESRWKGGRQGIYVYIAYMRERLVQCERVLKNTGSLFVHCDWHASHYLKVMMDEVFGYDNFLNEIIWWYHDPAGTVKDRFKKKHDVLLFYAKSNGKQTFNRDAVRTPYKAGTLAQEEAGSTSFGKVVECNPLGKVREDVWEIPFINSQAKERLGYPTQKPEALLEVVIKAASNAGDIVLDGFCGCGTSLAVAKRLGRRFIGIDISRTGCDVTRERLGGNVRVIGGETMDELQQMDPHDFARLLIQEKMGGTVNPRKSGDGGIDGWLEFKTIPVQVKRWGHKAGRPEVDKFRTAVARNGKKNGIMVAFEFSREAVAEGARPGADGVQVQCVRVATIVDGSWKSHLGR